MLRSREATIDEHVGEHFGTLLAQPVRGGYDTAGWVSGVRAAEQAQLSFGLLDN